MMNIAVDLHIHSVLSPCADDSMTPNNIVNMALLKNLDVIAVTDHNSCNNVEAVVKAAAGRILVLPGMELQTREEAHVLAYFKDLETMHAFNEVIAGKMSPLTNNSAIFGRQIIMNEKDEVMGERSESLLSSLLLSIDDAVDLVTSLGGIVVPAHVNRPSYSILSQLGFIDSSWRFNVLEFSQNYAFDMQAFPGYQLIFSSDAHTIGDILERQMFLNVEKITTQGVFHCLKQR